MKILRSFKNKILIVLLVIFSLSVFLLGVNLNRNTAKADVTTVVEYTDNFSDSEISTEHWTLINNTGTDVEFLDVEYEGLIFGAYYNTYMGQVSYAPYKMEAANKSVGERSWKVEMVTLCEEGNGWLAFSAGNVQTALGMPYSSAAFVMAPGYAHIFVKDGQFIAVDESHAQTFSPLLAKYNGQLMQTTFEFQETAAQYYYDIKYTVKTMTGLEIGSYVYPNILIQDGYFGFNSQYCDLSIVSFKVYEGNELKVNLDGMNEDPTLRTLGDTSILYPTTGKPDSEWVVAQDFDATSLKVGVLANLDVSKVGTSAVYNKKYERPATKELEQLSSLSAEVHTSEMGVGVATGFEFGKASVEASGIFAGLTKGNNGEYYLVSYDGLNQNKVAINEAAMDGLTMQLNVYYDNTAVISIGDTSLKFACSAVEGYFALTTVDFYNCFEGQNGAKLSHFVYNRDTYQNVQSKDMGINFEGTKTTYYEAMGAEATDYYIHKKDWRIAEDVVVPMYYGETENNVVTFSGLNPTSYFGPNVSYSNFIVRFDITFFRDVDAVEQPIFGLQFGMEDTDTAVSESYFLGIQSFMQQSYVISQNAKLTSGASIAPLCSDPYNAKQENIFKKNQTYNVMYVAENGNVKLYLKEKSQDNSLFEMLRGEIKGVNTQGYLQLYTMNYAKFDLDNFSVVNLDYNMTSTKYDGNGYEALRSDFVMGDKLEGFSLNNAEYKDTSLLVKEGGYLLSNEKIKNEIFRFKTKASTGDVIFEQGELKIKFAASGDNIFVVHNKKIREFILDEKIDFDGAVFEIYKMGNSLIISYVNGNQPVSCIKNHQYAIVADNLFDSNIRLYSGNGSLELYAVSMFDLKPSRTIATRDYNPELDYVNPWVEKPSIQEVNGENTGDTGCNASISAMAVLPVVVALASVFMLRRRKDEKNQ